MASKYQLIIAIYEEVCKEVVRDKESWKEFLTTAGPNYKLRFYEQLLIYAQSSDAIAVLEIEKWNNSFHRWVNKGAKGITVFNEQYAGRQRLKYYFDVSDTHEGRNPRAVSFRNEYILFGKEHRVIMIIMNSPYVLEICMTMKSNISLIL